MSGTDLVQRTPAQQLALRVRQDATFKQELEAALPASVTVDRFIRIAYTAVTTNPDIAKLEHNSVLTAMLRAAADGLMPDGREAAITPRGGKAVYVPMIAGYRKKAAEHGWTLRTAVVYENDEFDHLVEDGEEKILHRPVRPGADRGELIAAYAIAKHRDGRKILTVLHPEDIAKRRASASTQNVWNSHPAAMWEKSAGRDLFGQLGLAEGDAAIQRMLSADEFEHGEAANALYGPPHRGELPAAASTTRDTSEPPAAAGDRQQASSAASTEGPRAADEVPDDEPVVDDEPIVEEVDEDAAIAIKAAADEAGMFVPPNGQHKEANRTLGEILALGDKGKGWFRWALGKGPDLTPDAYRVAVWNFARHYLPELYDEKLAALEQAA